MVLPVWLLGLVSNGLVLLGSFWIARDGLRQPRGIATFLGTAVMFWTGCTLGLEVLSPFAAIAPVPMLAWGVLWLALGGLARLLRGKSGGRIIEKDSETGFSAVSIVGLGLLLSAALILGMRSLLLAVKVVSDGPIYHLYFAVRWWKAGRLILVAAPFGENAATYFPANGDLWFTWLLASWGGDRLAKVGQAPFLVLATVAAFGCARAARCRAGRRASSRPAWFASSTPFLLYSFEPNVDTIFVAGYMMAAYFFLHALRGEGSSARAPAGGAGRRRGAGDQGCRRRIHSAAPGSDDRDDPLQAKHSEYEARSSSRRPACSAGERRILVFLATRFSTGNPLYPLELRVLGHTVLAGWYGPEAMRLSPYYLPFADWRALADILLAVLDPRLAPLWAAAVVAGWALVSSNRSGTRAWAAAFGLLAILNVALYWAFIPYRSQQRFMLQALGLAVVPLALLLDRVRFLSLAAAVLLGMHLLTPECWPFLSADGSVPWDLSADVPNAVGAPIPLFPRFESAFRENRNENAYLGLASLGAILATSVVVAWGWCSVVRARLRRVRRAATALGATAVLLGLGYVDVWLEPQSQRFVSYPPFSDFYLGWQRLEAFSGPRGSRVAYAGTNIPYYLFGKGLRNDVRYVNISVRPDWLLHDYHRRAFRDGAGTWPNPRPGWDRSDGDFPAWLANLDAEGIQLLVVTRVNPAEGSHNVADRDGFPIERGWAESHPERFEVIYGRTENDPWFRLYRLRRRSRG